MTRPVTFLQRAVAALALLGGIVACIPGRGPAGEPAPGGSLTIASYNIRHGRGMDDQVNLERTAAVLRALAPDIVGLQEVDVGVARSGSIDETAELGRLLGMHHAFGSFMDYQGGQYGMGILSRFPVARTHVVQLPRGNEPRVALAVEVRPPGIGAVMVVNVHFDWVNDDGFRFAQASALTSFLDTLSIPYILLGDFNDVPGSRTLALFHARAMEAQKPADDRLTFSSTDPAKEIDFIFASPARSWSAASVRVIDERVASDHRPVVALLRYARRE